MTRLKQYRIRKVKSAEPDQIIHIPRQTFHNRNQLCTLQTKCCFGELFALAEDCALKPVDCSQILCQLSTDCFIFSHNYTYCRSNNCFIFTHNQRYCRSLDCFIFTRNQCYSRSFDCFIFTHNLRYCRLLDCFIFTHNQTYCRSLDCLHSLIITSPIAQGFLQLDDN